MSFILGQILSIIAPVETVKKVFEIISPSAEQVIQPVLSIRAGLNHFAYVITERATGEIRKLEYFTGDGYDQQSVSELIRTLTAPGNPFYRVSICYDYPWSMFVPAPGFRHEDANLLKMPIISGTVSITEFIPEWQLYAVYAAPAEIHRLFTTQFGTAKFYSQAGIILKHSKTALPGGYLAVDIRHTDFFVLAAKSGKLLAAQNYEYNTPEDVLYYLLRICHQFSLSQNAVQLRLSGLVDKQSTLFKDLYQYFIDLDFRETDWNMRGTDYPAHFFTSLNDLSRCE